jgi:hypothetical protein
MFIILKSNLDEFWGFYILAKAAGLPFPALIP